MRIPAVVVGTTRCTIVDLDAGTLCDVCLWNNPSSFGLLLHNKTLVIVYRASTVGRKTVADPMYAFFAYRNVVLFELHTYRRYRIFNLRVLDISIVVDKLLTLKTAT